MPTNATQSSAYLILVFGFGAPHDIKPNIIISRIAAKKARELNAPIFTQKDLHFGGDVSVIYIEDILGQPAHSTLRMARGAVDYASRHGLTTLGVVAAKPHLERALRDTAYAIAEAEARISVKVFKEILKYPENTWYVNESIQRKTRSADRWRRSERILMSMPMWLYKLIFR